MRAECGLLTSKITGLAARATPTGSPAPAVSGIAGPPLPPHARETSGSPAASRPQKSGLRRPARYLGAARPCLTRLRRGRAPARAPKREPRDHGDHPRSANLSEYYLV